MECACESEDLYTSLQDQNRWHIPVLYDPTKCIHKTETSWNL
jgi:hypothetical protein